MNENSIFEGFKIFLFSTERNNMQEFVFTIFFEEAERAAV